MTGAGADAGGQPEVAGTGFTVVQDDEFWQGHIVSLHRLWLTAPSGERFEREVVRHPGAVAVVAMDDGVASLVRQFRAPIGDTVLEVPAGTCDTVGESLEGTARRELAEEAGLDAGAWRVLVAAFNAPGYCNQVTTIFLATELSPRATARSGVEERAMTVERVSLRDVPALVAAGHIRDATTIVGLMLARETQKP